MRNLWLSLALLAAVSFSPHPSFSAPPTTAIGMPQQCVNNATNPTSAEWLTCTQARAGTSALNPIYVSGGGGGGGTANTQWYTGAAWQNWAGQTAGSDTVSNATAAPFIYNLPTIYNANSGKFERDQGYARLQLYGGAPGTWVNISQGISADSFNTSTAPMLPTINLPMYFTGAGTAWNRTRGAVAGADGVANTAIHGMNEFTYNMVWDSVGSHWDRMTQPAGGASGASGDAVSRTQTGAYSLSMNHFDNGTNFQRWKGEQWDTSMDITTAPGVLALGVFSDLGGGKGYRAQGENWDADMAGGVQLNVNSWGVYKDLGLAKNAYVTGDNWDTDITVTNGPASIALTTFFTGSAGYKWSGEAWDADMGITTNPNVNSLNVYRDTTNSKNLWWTGETWDTSMDIIVAPSVNSNTSFYNATASKGSWWNGITLADNMAAAPVAPFTISLGTFFNGTNNQRLTGPAAGADSISNSTPAPWGNAFNYGFNGTSWDRLYVLGTQADAQATTVNGLVTSSFLYGYNGSTFDMLRIGASNELQVTDVAVRPGEDVANDYRKVKVDSIATSTPAKKTTAVDSAGTDIVVASTQVIGYTNFCVYVKNVGGGSGAAFNNLQFQSSPDDTSWTGDLGWTDCDTAASGTTCVYCVSGNGYNYVRAVASTSASDTTADGWITLNKG